MARRFASTYGEAFHRIEALTEVDGQMKVIDLKVEATRDAIQVAKHRAIDLYRSTIAVDYGSKH
jgi:type III restriction enzyme